MSRFLLLTFPTVPLGCISSLVGILCLSGLSLFSSPAHCGWKTFDTRDGLGDNVVADIFEDSNQVLWFATVNGGVSRYDGVNWTTFTTEDGLAQNHVRQILEAPSGVFWFRTSNQGVSSFDGTNWESFSVAEGLGDSTTTSILMDALGNLWVGSIFGGVSRYDGQTWTSFDRGVLGNNHVTSLFEDSSGNIWVGAQFGGVSRYDGSNWTRFTAGDGLASDWVRDMVEDASGALWFATQGGVNRYEAGVWQTFTTADGLVANNVLGVLEDTSGSLWFNTVNGASRYDGTTWTSFTVADGLPDRIDGVIEDSRGSIWFWNYGSSATRYDGSSLRYFNLGDGLVSHSILSMFVDSSGALWFGTDEGLSRYDHSDWTTFSAANGLVTNQVQAMAEEASGALWFGTNFGISRYDGQSFESFLFGTNIYAALSDAAGNLWFGTMNGAVRYDGVTWTTFTTADGLVNNWVKTIFEDSLGNLWFGTNAGVSHFDGATWTSFTVLNGLIASTIEDIAEDDSGSIWFAAWTFGSGAVSRYDGATWTHFTTDDGLGDGIATSILVDSANKVWTGTRGGGVSRYLPATSSWEVLTTAHGLPDNTVQDVLQDGSGAMWFATERGISRLDNGLWGNYTEEPGGLPSDFVLTTFEDRSGTLWFGTPSGVARHNPDLTRPQTVITVKPPDASSNTIHTISFSAGFTENRGIRFSYSFDGASWTDWSTVNTWVGEFLTDGPHVFRVTTRDLIGNVDTTPATWGFEIDSSPPEPIIASPAFGDAVQGEVAIAGHAQDPRFTGYTLRIRPTGAETWLPPDAQVILQSSSPVVADTLGVWDSTVLADGDYDLLLAVSDNLGLIGNSIVTVTVDNKEPFAEVTSPVRINAAKGGDVFTTHREAHLYFPPQAFSQDVLVTIDPTDDNDVPDTLPNGAPKLLSGFEIQWGATDLDKIATMELSLVGISPRPDPEDVTVYRKKEGGGWGWMGGTAIEEEGVIVLPVNRDGSYAVFGPGDVTPELPTTILSAVSLTPRIFSPLGSFASREITISFVLGRAGETTVKIFNRSGRLVREVASGQTLNVGANVVRWDGMNTDGSAVEDGLYIVSVEALGEKQTQTLAVVR